VPAPDPRRLAVDALVRIDDGAYANLVVPPLLDASGLPERDRGFVTELVYGTTRMRRACDHLVDRFVLRPLDPPTRAALRLGAYQLHVLRTPAHAAVSATVEAAPRRSRGLVNAVLRRVAAAPVAWPSEAVRLSYPDWVVERLAHDLGPADATAALEQMNEAPGVTERPDGYVQDLASQWVAASVEVERGQRVADLCAAPGGKATFLAGRGARVLASDVAPGRARLVAGNAARTGQPAVRVAVADGRHPPWRPGALDHVLVDAPCSGLGVLRRRPDARWRITADDVARLATLQRELLDAAAALVAPGGTVTYSVCTLTRAESLEVDAWAAQRHPHLEALPSPGAPWRPHGRGALLLPQTAGTDGMALLRLRLASPP
jgi:16S rRNA (cytosine967-C5)-methyltransferase